MKTYIVLLSKSRCVCVFHYLFFECFILRFIFILCIKVFDCLYRGTPVVFIVLKEAPKRGSDTVRLELHEPHVGAEPGTSAKAASVFSLLLVPSFFFSVSSLRGYPYVILTSLQL